MAQTISPVVQEALDALLGETDGVTQCVETARGLVFDQGLAWVHHDLGMGGLGAAPDEQPAVDAALRTSGYPVPSLATLIGCRMIGPLLHRRGTPEQRRRHLRPLYTGGELWCHLLSEPGAGSDLAGISTSARLVDGAWVLNGQKVWTTLAHVATWGLCIARHDPSDRHGGLSAFVIDMSADGVGVRPLREMTGEAEFSEVFLTDVVVDDDARLGPLGCGWEIIRELLDAERASIATEAGSAQADPDGPVRDLLALWRSGPRPELRDRVVQAWIRGRITALNVARAVATGDEAIGAASPFGKLAFTELARDVYDCALDVVGAGGMLYPSGYDVVVPDEIGFAGRPVEWSFLHSRGRTIGGGTSEVLRNVLAERQLGMPRS